MSIVYVHGVATRENDPSYRAHLDQIETLLTRYVAPAISPACKSFSAYWGDYGTKFAWDRESRPKTVLLGQGARENSFTDAGKATLIASLDDLASAVPDVPISASTQGVLVPAGPLRSGDTVTSGFRLKDLQPNVLSDLLSATILPTVQDPMGRTEMLIAADEVVHEPNTQRCLAACANMQDEIEVLRKLFEQKPIGELVGQGAGSVWNKVVDRVSEAASRITNAPAFAISMVVAEWREPINRLVTLFVGDVFTYLANRGTPDKPGDIPRVVLETMKQAKASNPTEPLIVLSHSMGGQVVYDLVSHFLPRMRSDIRIDYWCATASQVGLFEEMKLFCASKEAYSKVHNNKVPFVDRHYLGGWWNVWDHNDFLSYTTQPVFEGVDDEAYDSGVSLIQSHGEYLLRPSFYRKLADKLEQAKSQNWWRP